ncbi:MAG TPA: hypothetical protein GX404_06885 [Syntrophomonadaceae bacterium]|nr:hypothetical protein [Syntrophomonadaceae bacterium]
MNLGIDIDNTITNTKETIYRYAQRFADRNGYSLNPDINEYRLEQSFGWDTELTRRFLKENLVDIYINVSPKPYAIETINRLYEKHRIVLITSRNERKAEIKNATLYWLKKHGLRYHKLIMNRTDNMFHFSKLTACLENKIDLMIEDHHDLCLEISHHIPVLMFDTPYNAHVKADNIIRVSSWLQVEELIQQFEHSTIHDDV